MGNILDTDSVKASQVASAKGSNEDSLKLWLLTCFQFVQKQRPCVGGLGKACLVWTVLSVQGFLVWTVSCALYAKQALGHRSPSRDEAQKAEAVVGLDRLQDLQ